MEKGHILWLNMSPRCSTYEDKLLGLTAQDQPLLFGTLIELCYFRENPQERTVKKWLGKREDIISRGRTPTLICLLYHNL